MLYKTVAALAFFGGADAFQAGIAPSRSVVQAHKAVTMQVTEAEVAAPVALAKVSRTLVCRPRAALVKAGGMPLTCTQTAQKGTQPDAASAGSSTPPCARARACRAPRRSSPRGAVLTAERRMPTAGR